MPRLPRVVIPGIPHHITQRGNNRKQVFFSDRDRLLYLRLLRDYAQLHRLSLWGYCLMPNHIHLIAVPHEPDSLARTLGRTHAEYARAANIQARTSGHFWQARFYSCAMDERHCWFAMAYVEQNPVRAGLAAHAEDFVWSSAPAHLGGPDVSGILETSTWANYYDPDTWRTILSGLSRDQLLAKRLRQSTRTGRPFGEDAFLTELENAHGLTLRQKPRGGPRPRVSAAAAPSKVPEYPVPL